jgi:putative transposase
VVDCHTREALSIAPGVSFRAYQGVEGLDQLAKERGRPNSLRADNVLRSEERWRTGQQVSVREDALAA